VFGAELVSGIDVVLDLVDFDRGARRAVGVVTGEGCLDAQTGEGKVVSGVARRCARLRRPVHAVVGRSRLTPAQAARLGLAGVREASTLAEIEQAGYDLAAAAGRADAGAS
jgi:glycerate kinase